MSHDGANDENYQDNNDKKIAQDHVPSFARVSGGRKSSGGERGEAPKMDRWTKSPQKLNQHADIFFTDFEYKNDPNLKISHSSCTEF